MYMARYNGFENIILISRNQHKFAGCTFLTRKLNDRVNFE